ncbi:MAG: phosphate signaling complex protein PhoU [Myxococcales bacterium]|jgi:phosphate transport system protein
MRRVHTDREYAEHLRGVGERLRRMTGAVQEMLRDGVQALVEGDKRLALSTIQRDRAVNRLELEIDELCVLILARWQPVASDLRFVTTALKLVTDLERVGDLASNIAERVLELSDGPFVWDREAFMHMSEVVQGMVGDATGAFVERDEEQARAVIERDDEADARYQQLLQGVIDVMKARPELVHDGVHVQAVAKWLERVADHATNVAEQTIFLVRGKDVRHGPLPR